MCNVPNRFRHTAVSLLIQSNRSVLSPAVLCHWGLFITLVTIHCLAHSDVPAWCPWKAQHLNRLPL